MIKQVAPGITKLRLKTNLSCVRAVVSVSRVGRSVEILLDNGDTLTESELFAHWLRGE